MSSAIANPIKFRLPKYSTNWIDSDTALKLEFEEIAAAFGWDTQKSTKVEFEDLPKRNKATMLELAYRILQNKHKIL